MQSAGGKKVSPQGIKTRYYHLDGIFNNVYKQSIYFNIMHLYLFSSIYIRYISDLESNNTFVPFFSTLTVTKYDRNNQGRLLEK